MSSVAERLKLVAKNQRESQLQMTNIVDSIINDGGIGFIEAGTGTGKSFAYLIPSIFSGKKVVISTAKKALQTQLCQKDIPFLLEKFTDAKQPFIYTQLKGKGNYGCLLNTNNYITSCPDSIKPKVRRYLDWLQTSQTADNGTYSDIISFGDETRVTECTWKNCEYMSSCGYLKNKTKAKDADILVVNHALLAYDLAMNILGDYDVLIIDEAHQAAEFFRDALSYQVTDEFYKINSQLGDNAGVDVPTIFANLIEMVFTTIGDKEGKVYLPKLNSIFKAINEECTTFLEYLKTKGASNEEGSGDPKLALLNKNFMDLFNQSKVILDENNENFVTYKEEMTLVTSPLNIGGIIGPALKDIPSVIFTSATIATEGNFSYIMRDMGLQKTDVKYETVLPSPFDYKNRTGLYITGATPDPSQLKGELYYDQMLGPICNLLDYSKGGAFILCTSKNDMYEYYNRLKTRYNNIMVQYNQLDPLIIKFKENPRSILLGVKSLWEGVDVPGIGLRLVIIPKLPFPTPMDVILTEKKKQYQENLEEAGIERASLKAWEAYDLQRAIIDLKQGVGRLMRSETDVGVVAILDPRLTTKSYSNRMLRSLPMPVTKNLAGVKVFLETISGKLP